MGPGREGTGRYYTSFPHIHKFCLLQALEKGGCLCVGDLPRGGRLHGPHGLYYILHRGLRCLQQLARQGERGSENQLS
jgi:hypothetical protein